MNFSQSSYTNRFGEKQISFNISKIGSRMFGIDNLGSQRQCYQSIRSEAVFLIYYSCLTYIFVNSSQSNIWWGHFWLSWRINVLALSVSLRSSQIWVIWLSDIIKWTPLLGNVKLPFEILLYFGSPVWIFYLSLLEYNLFVRIMSFLMQLRQTGQTMIK